MTTILHRVSLLALAGFLTGCSSAPKSEYVVRLRNNTGGVVAAQITSDAEDKYHVYYNLPMFPNSRDELGPFKRPANETLMVRVDSRDNPGFPTRMPIHPGLNIVSITRQGDQGKFILEQVPQN